MVEGIIDKLSDKWDQQETEHNAHIDLLIELQCDQLQMEKDTLAFKRELAGLRFKVSGDHYFCFMAGWLCKCIVNSFCSYHLQWLFFYPDRHRLWCFWSPHYPVWFLCLQNLRHRPPLYTNCVEHKQQQRIEFVFQTVHFQLH